MKQKYKHGSFSEKQINHFSKERIMLIKKVLFVCMTLLLGLFWVNCSDDGDSDKVVTTSTLRAVPVAAASQGEMPKILDSWTAEDRHWYVIDVGYIRNALISQIGPVHYPGVASVTLTRNELLETSMTNSRTEVVLDNVFVSNSSTSFSTIETIVEAKVNAGIGWGIFRVGGSLGSTITNSSGTSRTVVTSHGRTTETTTSFIETLTNRVENTVSITISDGNPAGWYRYAWYTTTDVYFLISTCSDKKKLLSWDVISCPRTSSLTYQALEYSSDPNGKFNNSPLAGNEIVFAKDFYKSLPTPSVRLSKIDTATFSTVGIHTYTFNKTFPATVEIYAVGAGGGGQGGHRYERVMTSHASGSGAGGGGGAAAYKNFTITGPTDFRIMVGSGGSGGAGFHERRVDALRFRDYGATTSGYPGSDGGNTSVVWGNNTFIAAGGSGGGGGRSGDDRLAGTGGSAARDLLASHTASGNSGKNGTQSTNAGNTGGNAGKIFIGAINPFPIGNIGNGGSGGYDRSGAGANGVRGEVRIVVTY